MPQSLGGQLCNEGKKAPNPTNLHGIPQAYFFIILVEYPEEKIVYEFLHAMIHVFKITTE